MIDYGLLSSIILAVGLPTLLARQWRITGPDGPVGFMDIAVGPAFAGLAAGRLTTLALDDPQSIGSLSDLLIIRSGVEFWPAVLVAVAVLAVVARRAGVRPLGRVAEVTPLSMVGYAAYEAACLFRDGCYGPESAVGLRAPGLSTTMLPVGVLMGIAVVVGAVVVHRMQGSPAGSMSVMLCGALVVAVVRSVGSFWLPHIGTGLTRQHVSSIFVAAALIVGLAVCVGRSGQEPDSTS